MSAARLEAALDRFAALQALVVGDFFLDKYLDIEPALSGPSLETGLPAHQVTGVRCHPGAAGTVVSNLRALDVNVSVLGVIGDDGEGHDLRRGLESMGVDAGGLLTARGRFTPTYMKPMLHEAGGLRELNRLDIINRSPLPDVLEREVIARLRALAAQAHCVIICDQAPGTNCGVITDRVRAELSALARARPEGVMLADSRERIDAFRDVIVKPNVREAMRATGHADPLAAGLELRRRTGRPVVVTDSVRGVIIIDEHGAARVAAVPVSGPIDVVGAGDSLLAAMAASLAAGAALIEAAQLGCLAASITIQQLGVTGTASRAQLRALLHQYALPGVSGAAG